MQYIQYILDFNIVGTFKSVSAPTTDVKNKERVNLHHMKAIYYYCQHPQFWSNLLQSETVITIMIGKDYSTMIQTLGQTFFDHFFGRIEKAKISLRI